MKPNLKVYSDDSELISRLCKGDVDAFDRIYSRYARKLYAFSIKYLKSVEESEGLVQSVFLKVWENRQKLKKDSSFKSYLFTIAYNDICNVFRRKTYEKKLLAELVFSKDQLTDITENQINYHSVVIQIKEIVLRLPEKQRKIFIESRLNGKTSKEIAKDFGLSSGTIDNYLSEALKFIRNNMKKEQIALLLFFFMFLY